MGFLAAHLLMVGMENAKPEKMSEQKVRDLVKAYIPKIKDDPFAKKDTSFYYREEKKEPSEGFAKLIGQEVDAGPFCEYEDRGIICADNKLFLVDLYKGKVKFLTIPGRIEYDDTKQAAVSAIACAKMLGASSERILLGENVGRVLVANPETHEIKTFGHVSGKVLGFACHPMGTQLAVKYASIDSAFLTTPCLALSAAYLKSQKALSMNIPKNRRSWAPVGNWEWSDFATKPCEHEVKSIHFEDELCVTECAGTGAIESWKLENLENQPQLVKVSEVKKNSNP